MEPLNERVTSITRIELRTTPSPGAEREFAARYDDYLAFLEKQDGMLISQLAIGHQQAGLFYELTRWENADAFAGLTRQPRYTEHHNWLSGLADVTAEVTLTARQVASGRFNHGG
ncbi:Antibiotic biosynthesis monooxygenase [Actinobacteria bacterium OK074]|nr:Antibiotic biosynthesis monooxygenase [Actinobacteria bacterium OK074]